MQWIVVSSAYKIVTDDGMSARHHGGDEPK
jgi:hypothetical protein